MLMILGYVYLILHLAVWFLVSSKETRESGGILPVHSPGSCATAPHFQKSYYLFYCRHHEPAQQILVHRNIIHIATPWTCSVHINYVKLNNLCTSWIGTTGTMSTYSECWAIKSVVAKMQSDIADSLSPPHIHMPNEPSNKAIKLWHIMFSSL